MIRTTTFIGLCSLSLACALPGARAEDEIPTGDYPNATFSQASDSVNREGKPQQWQTAPDDALPEDFASGDELIKVWNAEPPTLTPFVSRDAYSTRIYREVLEQLVWYDVDTLRIVPGLAKSWEYSDDGLTLTFYLFENATFSDGKPVTAEDVVFSFDLASNPEIDAPVIRSYIADNVASWRAVDTHTVEFTLTKPYFLSLEVCGQHWILPRHVYGDYPPNVYNTEIRDVLVGSGPWKLERWDKGTQIVLTRNENYWGPKTPLNRQTIRYINSDLAELQEFWAGNADLIEPSSEQYTQYKSSQEIDGRNAEAFEYDSPLGGYSYIGYNHRRPVFADRRVRQAMTMLIDRWELIDTLRNGIGQVVSGPFYYGADQYNIDIDPWPYDPDAARALLAEAGWEDTDGDGVIDKDLDGDGIRDPFQFTFLMPSGSVITERLQRYVLDQCNEAGIKVQLDELEWSVFEKRLTERDFEVVCLSWTGSPESDPFQIWHSSQAENRGSNYIGYRNDEVDRLIEEGRSTLDYNARMEIWHEVHRLIHEDQPYTFLFSRPTVVFIDKRFRNVKRHPFRLYASEWYVPQVQQMRN